MDIMVDIIILKQKMAALETAVTELENKLAETIDATSKTVAAEAPSDIEMPVSEG